MLAVPRLSNELWYGGGHATTMILSWHQCLIYVLWAKASPSADTALSE